MNVLSTTQQMNISNKHHELCDAYFPDVRKDIRYNYDGQQGLSQVLLHILRDTPIEIPFLNIGTIVTDHDYILPCYIYSKKINDNTYKCYIGKQSGDSAILDIVSKIKSLILESPDVKKRLKSLFLDASKGNIDSSLLQIYSSGTIESLLSNIPLEQHNILVDRQSLIIQRRISIDELARYVLNNCSEYDITEHVSTQLGLEALRLHTCSEESSNEFVYV